MTSGALAHNRGASAGERSEHRIALVLPILYATLRVATSDNEITSDNGQNGPGPEPRAGVTLRSVR